MSLKNKKFRFFWVVLLVSIITAVFIDNSLSSQKKSFNSEATSRLNILSESMKASDINEIRNLIKAGADVSVKNKHGNTPLCKATVKGYTEIVILLLDAWADFLDCSINHDYELKMIQGDKAVIDHATNLMWHQSGSDEMEWEDAKEWVRDLNQQVYAGYNNWRFPTVAEAGSLLDSSMLGDLFTDAVFDVYGSYYWTGSKYGDSEVWTIILCWSTVSRNRIEGECSVRPVRSYN